MSAHAILSGNWSAYDSRKKRDASDHNNFDGSKAWEINYLGRLIRKQHPDVSTDKIRTAIKACCKLTGTPYPRSAFVACVIETLTSL